jgi:hypothetical protein
VSVPPRSAHAVALVAALLLVAARGGAGAQAAATRVTRTMRVALHAGAAEAFPLFGPVREMDWDPGWKPEFRFPTDRSQSAAGAVFTVRHAGSDLESTWIMDVYDTTTRTIRYVRVIPGSTAMQLDIVVAPTGPASSVATVTYTMTGLSEAGNAAIARFVETFPHRQAQWEQVLNHFIDTGKPLVH